MKQYKQLNPYSIRTQEKLLRRMGGTPVDLNDIKAQAEKNKKKRKIKKKMRQKSRRA